VEEGEQEMSSLVFFTDAEQALVATDTLATKPEGSPMMFTSKAFIVPHLQLIICGIGIQSVAGKWAAEVNDKMIVRGIDNLDYHTPRALASLCEKHRSENSIPGNVVTTIYHFGFSEEDGLIHAYAYRSVNEFVSERLSYGTRVKPECIPADTVQFPADLKRIMDEQRHIQLSRPIEERVYIGGKIQVFHLTKSGISVYTQDQFDDYESTLHMIFESFDSHKQ
jgi:hypothetical protein